MKMKMSEKEKEFYKKLINSPAFNAKILLSKVARNILHINLDLLEKSDEEIKQMLNDFIDEIETVKKAGDKK